MPLSTNLKGRGFFSKTFNRVFIFTLFLVLILEGLIFSGLQRQYRGNAVKLQESLILQYQKSTETLLKQAEKLSVSLAMHEELSGFTKRGFPREEFERFMSTMELLTLLVSGSVGENYQNLMIYHPLSDRVFSPDGIMQRIYSEEKDLILKAANPQLKREWTINDFRRSQRVLTYVTDIPLSGETGNLLVLNLNGSFLTDNFQSLLGKHNTMMIIRDAAGQAYDPYETGIDWDREWQDIKSHHHSAILGNGEKYYLTLIKSSYTNWTYYAFTPVKSVNSFEKNILTIMLLATALIIVVILFYSLILSFNLMKPLVRLKKVVYSAGSDSDGVNGFDLDELESYFTELKQVNLSYKERFDQNRRLLEEKYYWDLINGKPGDRLSLGLRSYPIYAVCLAEYDEELSGKEHIWMNLYETLEEWVEENQSRGFIKVLNDYRHIIFIVGLSPGTNPLDLAEECRLLLLDKADYPFYLALGASVDTWNTLFLSYQNAQSLLGYKLLVPQDNILRDETYSLAHETFIESMNIEKAVLDFRNFLQGGNADRAKKVIEDIMESGEISGNIFYGRAKLYQFANILIHHMAQMGGTEGNRDNPWRSFSTLSTPDSLKLWFLERLEKLRSYLKNTDNNHQRIYVDKSLEYINIHYKENISIQNVADAAGINPAYLSTLFKRSTGISFSGYLLNLRLKNAESLLRESNDTVETIAVESGFITKQNIIRAFKNSYGCTPGVYRLRNRKLSPSSPKP